MLPMASQSEVIHPSQPQRSRAISFNKKPLAHAGMPFTAYGQ